MPPLHNKHLLFFITEDWYFCSHRLPLAQAAIVEGFKVTLITQVHRYGDKIRAAGIHLIPIQINRSGLNPIHELMLIAKIYQLYTQYRPDIVHHVAMKPVIYGTIAARLVGISSIVNALAGLGFLFSSHNLLARLLKPLVQIILRWVLGGNSQVIVQNPDDMQLLCEQIGVSKHKIHLIYGAGVDLSSFTPTSPPIETLNGPIILLPARLLWDKGVGEFVQAATILRQRGITARCILVGAPDIGNPASVSQQQIASWVNAGIIEWWGYCDDMPKIFAKCHIVCLPSYYREGLPKSLVEAAACGKPIVTTDTPGCREVVRDGENGLLVPVRDVQALVSALAKLIQEPKLCVVYGKVGRQCSESMFGSDSIIQATLAVYDK